MKVDLHFVGFVNICAGLLVEGPLPPAPAATIDQLQCRSIILGRLRDDGFQRGSSFPLDNSFTSQHVFQLMATGLGQGEQVRSEVTLIFCTTSRSQVKSHLETTTERDDGFPHGNGFSECQRLST
jgi:hypothetical protein